MDEESKTMKFFNIIFIGVFLIFPLPVEAQDNSPIVGKYKSLNGEIEHHFVESGDYFGVSHYAKNKNQHQGVYKYSPGLCWLPASDGSKGLIGNVVIHYEEKQCCLLFENISDKIAVTFVWTKPYEHVGPFGICSSQVLKTVK